ncbi:MAG: hypothetical protein IPM51_00530 [Sphingobacteriaceae bacterium]|nr:hypothetical protein [Sphingobacteriaceae bacterium]
MKKNILIKLSAIALICGTVSCKKEYHCECHKTANSGTVEYQIKDTKKKAEEQCENYKSANPSLYSECHI